MSATLALLVLLALLLGAAAWCDLKARIIPNGLNLAIALLAVGWWWAQGWTFWPAILLQIGLALIVFAVFAGAFALGWMGGGDVKLLAALALWLPLPEMAEMLVLMALAGGVLTLLMLAAHRLRRAAGRPEIPYGVAIVAATLLVLANDILTIAGA